MASKKIADLLEIFEYWLKFFTDQPVKSILCDIKDSLSEDNWENDMKKYFSTTYPDAVWFFEIFIADFAVEYYRYKMGEISKEVMKKIFKDTKIHLREALSVQTNNLDWNLIHILSGEKYESETSEGLTMILIPFILPDSNLKKEKIVLQKEKMRVPLKYETIHSLRKQLNLGKNTRLVLAKKNIDDDIFEVVGFGSKSLDNCFPRVVFTGHMEVSFYLPVETKNETVSGCKLRIQGERILLPKLNLDKFYRKELESRLKDTTKAENIFKLLKKAIRQKKGAVIIIAKKKFIKEEKKRLSNKLRGIWLKEPISLLSSCFSSFAMKDMTSIDGALFVDLNGNCYAYGVILDGIACKEGDIGRGARFNSTKAYLEQKKEFNMIGIVVSEDGMVDILPD